MSKELIYSDYAKYYDLIYSFKDYNKEAEKIHALIQRYKKADGSDLLDVGCGTGKHLQGLKQHYSCTGFDYNQEMLDIARVDHPDVVFIQGDMADMDTGKQYDVIVSLFSVIGYVKTFDRLKMTLNAIAKHLMPGGVLIIEPWFSKTGFKPGNIHLMTYESPDIKIARIGHSELKEETISYMDLHYMVAERGKEVIYFVDRNVLGLFNQDETLQLMKEAGLKAKFLKNGLVKGRGLYVAVKMT